MPLAALVTTITLSLVSPMWIVDQQSADDAALKSTLDALPALSVLSSTKLHVLHPAGAGDEGEGGGDAGDDDAELQAALDEQQQASLEAYGKDIKELDEVFEVIAKVGSGQRAGTWCLNKLCVQLPAWPRHVLAYVSRHWWCHAAAMCPAS
jgi:hypothetical protein